MAAEFPDHPFWDFALDLYRRDGVSAACLNLQERHGVDVNLLLFCLWLGHSGRGTVDDAQMAALLAASAAWNDTVVKGLRQVRRVLKEGFPDVPATLRDRVRAAVQATEIDAEHAEQLILAGAADRPVTRAEAPGETRAGDAARNVGLYAAAREIAFEPADTADLAHILGQGFAGLGPERAAELAKSAG